MRSAEQDSQDSEYSEDYFVDRKFFTFRRKQSNHLNHVLSKYNQDPKSDSQIQFSEYMQTSKHWTLWHVLMLTVLTWNNLIETLQMLPLTLDLKYNIRCKAGCLEQSNWSFDQIKNFSFDYSLGVCAYKLYDYDKFCKVSFEEAREIVSSSEKKVEVKECVNLVMIHYLFPYTYRYQINEVCIERTRALPAVSTCAELFGLSVTLFMADLYGRKSVIVYSQIVYVISSIIRMCLREPISWYTLTFFMKASTTSATSASVILLLEIVHFNERPLGIALLNLGTIFGCIFKGLFYKYDKKWDLYEELMNCCLLVPVFSHWLLWDSPHWLLYRVKWVELGDLLKEVKSHGRINLSDFDDDLIPIETTSKILVSLRKSIFRNRILCNMILYSISNMLFTMQINNILYESKCENGLHLILSVALVAAIVTTPILLSTFSRPKSMCLTFLIIALQHTIATIYKFDESGRYFTICMSLVTTQMAIMLNEVLIAEKFPTKSRATALNICKISAVVFVSLANGLLKISNLKSNITNHDDFIYLILSLTAACICLFIKATSINMLPDTEIDAIMDL